MKTDIIIVGGFNEMIELCEDCGLNIVGIIDNELNGHYYDIPVIGKDQDAASLYERYKECKVVISPDLPEVRKKLAILYKTIGYHFINVISPNARISRYTTIGEGTVIQAGVNVSSATLIGDFCKLNTNCNVMHENKIGDYCTIAPNSVLLGRVQIGEKSYIGANSTLLPNIVVGKSCIVGAGAVVTRNVTDGMTVKGVPAK